MPVICHCLKAGGEVGCTAGLNAHFRRLAEENNLSFTDDATCKTLQTLHFIGLKTRLSSNPCCCCARAVKEVLDNLRVEALQNLEREYVHHGEYLS